MKRRFTKYFLGISLVGSCVIPIYSSSSCAADNDDPYYQYIWNRSFAILETAAQKNSPNRIRLGSATCWILDKISGSNPYEYYVGSNFHVTSLFVPDTAPDAGGWYDYSGSQGIIKINNFIPYVWTTSSIHDTAQWNYNYNEATQITVVNTDSSSYFNSNFRDYNSGATFPSSDNYLTDFSVLKIIFNNPTGAVKTKLDNLDASNKKLHFKTNRYTSSNASTFYTLGFPANYTNNGVMMDKTRGTDTIPNYYFTPQESLVISYWGNDNRITGLYYFMSANFRTWHGQSGSLVIDSNYNVIGLADLISNEDRQHTYSYVLLCSVGTKNANDYHEGFNYQYNFINNLCNQFGLNPDDYLV